VLGILPLAVIKSRIFGRSVTSLPFLDTAGVVAVDERAPQVLIERAVELAQEHGVSYLELRQLEDVGGDFRVDRHKVSLTLALKPTVEEQWSALASERRNRVRKARKSGLTVEVHDRSALKEYYHVWCRNMRDLGSPAHSVGFFERVFDVFPAHASILLVRKRQMSIGAAIAIEFKKVLAVPWVSSLRPFFTLHPNDIMYWEAMTLALKRGCRTLDFGRSTAGSGNHTYKTRWGAQARPLCWAYRSLGDRDPSLPNQDDPRYHLAVSLWKRLPVRLANLIGPRLRKGITS
jgi:FemAB-related protein (PEP-CTERM system-associated)